MGIAQSLIAIKDVKDCLPRCSKIIDTSWYPGEVSFDVQNDVLTSQAFEQFIDEMYSISLGQDGMMM